MDDDLMSLRGSTSNDDDLFGSFTDPDDLGFDAPPPAAGSASPGSDDFYFADPFDLPAFDEPAFTPEPVAPAPAPTPQPAKARPKPATMPKKSRKARRRASTGFLGLTAPQRMILSIFLFLDVAVLGALILLVIGAINI
jgi:hypothetical protein